MLEIKKHCKYYVGGTECEGYIHAICESNGSIIVIYETDDRTLLSAPLNSMDMRLVGEELPDHLVSGQDLIDFLDDWPLGDDWFYESGGYIDIDPRSYYDLRDMGSFLFLWEDVSAPKHWNHINVVNKELDFEPVFWWWKNHKDLGAGND